MCSILFTDIGHIKNYQKEHTLTLGEWLPSGRKELGKGST